MTSQSCVESSCFSLEADVGSGRRPPVGIATARMCACVAWTIIRGRLRNPQLDLTELIIASPFNRSRVIWESSLRP